MSYLSLDEIEQFSFEDCQILKAEKNQDKLTLQVEALIVQPNNSQNEQYIRSYADTSLIQFKKVSSFEMIREGYRYYDANDVLLETKPDTLLDESEAKKVLADCKGAYLFEVQKGPEENSISLRIEFADEVDQDPLACISYEIKLVCDQVAVSWDQYLNRVQS